eukprot:GHVN01051504.1.p1 GENE.GHVN01051504.1~~GHVN01051504.1.p1  ORF type:complete len:569 (-),score=90.35 GHVN01051504.1:661-2367(-)
MDDFPIPSQDDATEIKNKKSKPTFADEPPHEEPQKLPSMPPMDTEPKKKTETFSIKEAGGEIKRLRRETKVLREEMLRRRLAMEDLQKAMDTLQDESITLKEARKLTYKALRKGRALQFLAHMFSHSSVNYDLKRYSFNVLAKNAFGEGPFLYRYGPQNEGMRPGMLHPYNDSQLLLLRQEQLTLMAENERLVTQVKALETTFRAGEFDFVSPAGPRSSGIADAFMRLGSRRGPGREPSFSRGASKHLGGDRGQPDDDMSEGGVELDIDLVSRQIAAIFAVIAKARIRRMYHGMLKLVENTAYATGVAKAAERSRKTLGLYPLAFVLSGITQKEKLRNMSWGLHRLHLHTVVVQVAGDDDFTQGDSFDQYGNPRPHTGINRVPGAHRQRRDPRGGGYRSPPVHPQPYQKPHIPGHADNLQYQIPTPHHSITHAYVHQPAYFSQLPSNYGGPSKGSIFLPTALPPPDQSNKLYSTLPPEQPYYRPSTGSACKGVKTHPDHDKDHLNLPVGGGRSSLSGNRPRSTPHERGHDNEVGRAQRELGAVLGIGDDRPVGRGDGLTSTPFIRREL